MNKIGYKIMNTIEYKISSANITLNLFKNLVILRFCPAFLMAAIGKINLSS